MTCHGLENVSDKKEKWCIFNQSLFLMYFSVQSLSRVQLFVASWIAACQASLSITNSQSLLKLMSIEAVMPSNDLILCCLLLLPPSIFPSIRVFSNESILHIRWPEHWSFSFSIGPSNEHSGLISLRMACLALLRAAIRFYLQGCDGHSAAQRIASVRRTMFPWLNGQHYFIITQHCGHLKDRRKLSADQVSSQMNHSYSYRNRYLWSRY